MRIAVSGTHCSGKTTLVEDFVASHRDYIHEPEPYEWLTELYGESFSGTPTARDFERQLEMCVKRLRTYRRGAHVIFERSPIDFLAYMLALAELGRSSERMDRAIDLALRGMEHLDLLVVLPLDEEILAPESEDLDLRDVMNERLVEIITTDEFSLLGSTRVIEAHGARSARLAALENATRGLAARA